ncbi:hypothetical protein MTR67_034428 [Solanum verrucosum]|uniref:Tf2-1-like SH3-like domain-containing protein n=1 Tax=Solanum verrucosum TaxID=315347 RepID=A0AAF0ZKD6_SOLVR|nr:hypothetical protein MTR67_034428 [Solanum verrucosum]
MVQWLLRLWCYDWVERDGFEKTSGVCSQGGDNVLNGSGASPNGATNDPWNDTHTIGLFVGGSPQFSKYIKFQVRCSNFASVARDHLVDIKGWRFGKVAYELDLTNDLASVHPTFHVSRLKKCVGYRTSIVPLKGLEVKENLSYREVLIEILDRQVKKL